MFEILENKTILVVDDDQQNRETIIEALFVLSPNTKVLSATNGEQALKIALLKPVDLLLLDWEMPVLDGYQTLLRFKKNELLASIPVVMYTGIMTDITSLQKALSAGAADFLRKPTDPLEILARIRSILTQKKHQEDAINSDRERYQAQIQEMMTAVLHLQQMEVFVEKIQENLNEAIKAINPKENLQKMLRDIKQSDLSDNDWERYKLRLDAGQQGFLERLNQQYPDLTRQQLTICSLLRLGLVSKEAAKILDMSLEAMDKSRYRIRKKLGITQEVKLENFLVQI